MPKPEHDDIEHLLRNLVLPFHQIKRAIKVPIGDRHYENDAEHSWSLALLACSLAPQVDVELDTGKICQFAMVHDLVEIYAGDTSTFASAEEHASKPAREAQAAQTIITEFKAFPWIGETIEAYERKDSNEALFVYAVDKYIAVMYDYIDEARLFRDKKVTLAEYNEGLKDHRKKAQAHPVIARYYDHVRSLMDQRPEYFYQV